MKDEIADNINWIKSGKIGCVFASALVKNASNIGWEFMTATEKFELPKGAFLVSVVFPDGNIENVRGWALRNGFYIEDIGDLYEGLRINVGTCISWVQYFGQDSHVKTRQSPHAMLTFAVKLPAKYYAKVGFNGILHVAHASIQGLTQKVQDTLWKQSETKTQKVIGHKLTIREAAKTTFIKS